MNVLKKKVMFALLMLPFLGFTQENARLDRIPVVAKGAELKEVSNQFAFTEGPTVNKNGDVFFTDQPNNRIWKYSADGNLSIFMENAGRANGMYFDPKGNLVACADEKNELWSINPKGKVTVLLANFHEQRFNGPNDLWIDKNGGMYFTDPYYQRDYWKHNKPEIQEQRVYFLGKGAKEAIVVDGDLVQPNGIVGTPDGKHLFVADIKDNKTYKYDINKDGSLTNRRLFVNLGSDGMTIDNSGNLYLTGRGVSIFNVKGEKIGHILVPASWTANICFGGKERNTLFITASKSVFTLEMNVKGVER